MGLSGGLAANGGFNAVGQVDGSGTHAARPAANTVPANYIYFETDTGTAFQAQSGSWVQVAIATAPVSSFNNRTGAITLSKADVTGTGLAAADVSALASGTRLDQITAPTASVALNSQKITGLANGTAASDAAAFGQIPVLDATATDIQPLGTRAAGATGKAADAGHVHAMPTLDQIGAAAASVSLNSQKITSLANGSGAQDAAAFGQIPVVSNSRTGSTVTGTGAMANVTNLSWAIAANETWDFDCLIIASSSAGTTISFQLTGPASPTRVGIAAFSSAATGAGTATAFSSATANLTLSTAASGNYLRVSGEVANGSNAGTVQLQFNAASTVTLSANCWLRAWK